tara:strand:- start:164 stop:271 length:108 start_codon:yes stop_codon:yes gene_type:complete
MSPLRKENDSDATTGIVNKSAKINIDLFIIRKNAS